MKPTHWLWQMRRGGVREGLLGNALLAALQDAPTGIENPIVSMGQDTLAFPGRPANPTFGDPGQRSGIIEGIARLGARFLADAFDGGIAQLDRFYDLSRKGRMAEYLADFVQVYTDAQISSGPQLDDSSLTWHLLRGAHISPQERQMIMLQVGGNYHRFQDIYNLLGNVLPYDKTLEIALADGGGAKQDGGGGTTQPQQQQWVPPVQQWQSPPQQQTPPVQPVAWAAQQQQQQWQWPDGQPQQQTQPWSDPQQQQQWDIQQQVSAAQAQAWAAQQWPEVAVDDQAVWFGGLPMQELPV